MTDLSICLFDRFRLVQPSSGGRRPRPIFARDFSLRACRPPCVVHPSISSGAASECAGARTVTSLTDPRLLRELLAGGAWAVWVASLGGSRQDPESVEVVSFSP